MLISWDERRDIVTCEDASETITFAADHWLNLARSAIAKSGRFAVALSGGSTPKAIFEKLAKCPEALDWSKVWLFWSDERSISPEDPESNYHMAMTAGFSKLPISSKNIFRMKAENYIEKHALEYEEIIKKKLGKNLFDLVMLGIGEDGHTASLFPKTNALTVADRLVVANHIPQKNTWRMTFTFPCINQSNQSAIYALGSSKNQIVAQVLHAHLPSPWPASFVGTPSHKTLWVLDHLASKDLFNK
ncbi:MAG: 6-phosphogluconolactonase [Chlamydiales bacterium]|nr:6-phosphogluconolactonase [Chlamydiales bacterium]